MKLHEFMTTPDLVGDEFLDESWTVHREVLARIWDGDAHLIPTELIPVAHELLGTKELPTHEPAEMYLAISRGGGKTRFEAVAGTNAWAQDYRELGLAPGAWATIVCACPTQRQAAEWLNYCKGFVENSPILSEAISKITADCIESIHNTRLEVITSNFRHVRGFTSPLVIIDEASYLRDEFSATPDVELRNALNPTLGRLQVRGRMIVSSTLHRRTGLMWNMWRKHYGKVAA